IETDMLLAALNRKDPLNTMARKVLALTGLTLSPYALMELNLLARGGKIKVRDFEKYGQKLDAFLTTRGVSIIPDRPLHHSTAHRLEREFRLTFFDSLHASAALTEHEELISFDNSYSKLGRVGLTHIDPRKQR
ncbi:MAG: PIN domain-containing protein, partial [Thaumarchaeota archaeon]|nr:PIN domain-containing protein [Nitrososphaerota archaeon]